MNLFDAVIYLCLLVAVVAGFRSGLLRSLATILGYVCAAPLAVAAAPYLTPILTGQFRLPPVQISLVLFGIFVALGILLSALLRMAVSEMVGPDISAPDHLADGHA